MLSARFSSFLNLTRRISIQFFCQFTIEDVHSKICCFGPQFCQLVWKMQHTSRWLNGSSILSSVYSILLWCLRNDGFMADTLRFHPFFKWTLNMFAANYEVGWFCCQFPLWLFGQKHEKHLQFLFNVSRNSQNKYRWNDLEIEQRILHHQESLWT